ncbi:MAG: helix-turn-helix domain-containing protein [Bacteroidota bacterium]
MASIKSYDSLSALYKDNDVAKQIEQHVDFTIHKMQEVHAKPVESPVFRANYFSFLIVEKGRSFYTIDSHRFEVHDKTLYFTNPGHLKSFGIIETVHGYIVTTTAEYLKSHLHTNVFDEFDFLLAETVPPSKLTDAQLQELGQQAEQIERAYVNKSPLRNKILSSLFVVFLLKVKEILMGNEHFRLELDRDSRIVQDFKKGLEQVMRNKQLTQDLLSVSTFAEAQSLSPAYFSTVIKTKTNHSANHWIRTKLAEEASALLHHGDRNIKEIGYALGFSEPTHFTKFFKKMTGDTPSQFRKKRQP